MAAPPPSWGGSSATAHNNSTAFTAAPPLLSQQSGNFLPADVKPMAYENNPMFGANHNRSLSTAAGPSANVGGKRSQQSNIVYNILRGNLGSSATRDVEGSSVSTQIRKVPYLEVPRANVFNSAFNQTRDGQQLRLAQKQAVNSSKIDPQNIPRPTGASEVLRTPGGTKLESVLLVFIEVFFPAL